MKETCIINFLDNLETIWQCLKKWALVFSQINLEDYEGEAKSWAYNHAVIEGISGLHI